MQEKNLHIDTKILLRLREGDEKAFSIVFETYHRYLYVMACRYLMSEDYAEDAVQHTFMRLWENRKKIDYSKGVKNLLFTILKNYVLNEIRNQNYAIQKNYEIAQFNPQIEQSFLTRLEEEDFRFHFFKLIDQLPPQRKEVCLLKIVKGLSNQEIADEMKIAVPTVKSHYTQVIKFLRMHIDKITAIVLFTQYFR